MGRKNLKQKIAFVLATIVGTNILWQNIAMSSPKEEIKALQSLGDYKTYNGVVFGKHTASGADVEGKLAVKGDIEAPTIGNSFSIAAAFNGNNVAIGNPIIDTTTPTFLLGGEIIDTGTTAEGVKRNLLLSAGIGVLTSKANKDLLKSADKFEAIIEKSEAEVYETFDKIQNDINKSIEKVKTIESSDEKVSGSTLKFARAKLNKNILINEEWRNEKHLDFKGIDSWEFRIPKLEENDHLIMYSEAETINFDRALYYEGKEIGTYDKALMHKLAPRILWVFPNAKTIETLRVDVPGSIIAPNATVNVYGGSINGQVFTNDLNQIEKDTAKNGELHNFIFNWDILNNLEVTKGSLEIKKVESDNQDLVLSGAEFVIKDISGNEVARGTTDKNGIARFENLVAGTYTYEEIKAPDGYELNNEPVEFKITKQGEVITKVVENKKIIIKGTLEIKKVDADNKDLALPGAEFIIKDANGGEVAKGITDEKGIAKFENLVAGTYTYEEIKAPDGYELNNEPVEFKITDQGQVVIKVVENKKIIKGALEIKKVDTDNKNLALSGAEFIIKDVNGNEVAKGTTDEKGIAKFENLVAGKYTYEEIKAPEGYELNGKAIEFEITKQGEIVTKVVENKKSEDNTTGKPETPDEPNNPEDTEKPETPNEPNNPEDTEKPETPDEPNNPEDTEKPETPDEPNNPEDTEKPETPDEPNNPDDTEKPETPDEPSNPDDTEKPETPDEPNNPDDTEKPETPDEPNNPEDTEKPETPDEPNNPEDTEKPETPDEPSNPEDTEKPETPDEPNNPDDTEKPENPGKPSNQEDLGDPENPKKPEDSDELNKPNGQGNNIQNGANINQILGGERLPKTGDVGVMHYSIFSMLAISALFSINKKRKNKK